MGSADAIRYGEREGCGVVEDATSITDPSAGAGKAFSHMIQARCQNGLTSSEPSETDIRTVLALHGDGTTAALPPGSQPIGRQPSAGARGLIRDGASATIREAGAKPRRECARCERARRGTGESLALPESPEPADPFRLSTEPRPSRRDLLWKCGPYPHIVGSPRSQGATLLNTLDLSQTNRGVTGEGDQAARPSRLGRACCGAGRAGRHAAIVLSPSIGPGPENGWPAQRPGWLSRPDHRERLVCEGLSHASYEVSARADACVPRSGPGVWRDAALRGQRGCWGAEGCGAPATLVVTGAFPEGSGKAPAVCPELMPIQPNVIASGVSPPRERRGGTTICSAGLRNDL